MSNNNVNERINTLLEIIRNDKESVDAIFQSYKERVNSVLSDAFCGCVSIKDIDKVFSSFIKKFEFIAKNYDKCGCAAPCFFKEGDIITDFTNDIVSDTFYRIKFPIQRALNNIKVVDCEFIEKKYEKFSFVIIDIKTFVDIYKTTDTMQSVFNLGYFSFSTYKTKSEDKNKTNFFLAEGLTNVFCLEENAITLSIDEINDADIDYCVRFITDIDENKIKIFK